MNGWQGQFAAFLAPREPDRYGLYRVLLASLPDPEQFWTKFGEEAATLSLAKQALLPYLFLAAVQHEALGSTDETIARYFPASANYVSAPIENERLPFADFLARNWTAIWRLVRRENVQINKLGRLALFAPYFLDVCRRESDPAFIEAGSSVGFGLLWSGFTFHYPGHGTIVGPCARSTITCAVRGRPNTPLQGRLSNPSFLCGVDLHPLSVENRDQVRWLEALIAPGDAAGRDAFALGLEHARRTSTRIERGCVLEVLPRLQEELQPEQPLVVYHAMTMHHLRDAGKEAPLKSLLGKMSKGRDVYQIGVEWEETVPPPGQPRKVEVTYRVWKFAIPTTLASAVTDFSADGRWLEFPGQASSASSSGERENRSL